MTRRRCAALCLLVAVTLAACGTGGSGSAGDTGSRLPDVDTPVLERGSTDDAPTEGAPISLAEIDGPAVINIWATTCAPCVREMPALQSVAAAHPGVDFYGLNVAETPAVVAEFLDRFDITYAQLLDPAGYAQETLAIDSLPTTIIIDANDTVVRRHRGEITADDLADLLNELGPVPTESSASTPSS